MAARFAKMAANAAASFARSALVASAPQSAVLSQRSRVVNLMSIAQRPYSAPLASPFSVYGARSFCLSASASTTAGTVASVVGEELKYEQENYSKPAVSFGQETNDIFSGGFS